MRLGILLLGFFVAVWNCFGNVDFSKPEVVVSNAIESLIRKDFSNLILLTELSERKKVEKTIESYYGGGKLILDSEIGNLESFKVVDVYYEGEFAVVVVDWSLKNSFQSKDGVKSYVANRKVLYLLRKFDDKWKIISRKVSI